MLFDLRGRGRRRAVQGIYLALALLMGGGLIFFGIGGNTNGGLFDAFSQGGGDATKQIQERVDKARERTKAQPNNAALWASLAEAEYQLAGQSEGYNADTGEFTGKARSHLVAAQQAWQRHLKLTDDPNSQLAGTMRNALTALGDYEGAVRAQEIVLDSLPKPGFGDYAQLAVLAYQADQTRKGDLASQKAVALAPKGQKKDLKQQLDQAKVQSISAGAQGATTTPSGG